MSGTATDADTLYERAVEKELSGDLDGAFASYVQATQSYLHQSRATKSNAQREKLKSSASRSLERAEKIKAAKRDVQRVKMDTFSSEYQSYVLSRSSSRRGVRIPQWKTLPAKDTSQSAPFEDPENALFVQSTTSVCSWRRARDVFPDSEMHSTTLEPHDLLQGNPSDCSVIASLAICLNHHRLFGSYLGLSALYPQDPQGLPIDSPSGMHRAKLLLNGGLREIVIDDLLPIGEHNAPVCAISSGGKALWPTLLEKAYLKSNGGYGFSGSNSCSDVYAVTGWVPELISLTRSTTHRIPLWERLLEGHATGRCVITINTPIEATPFGLIPNHSYAVLKLFTSEGRQMVTLLDSQYTSEPASVKPPLNIDWDDVCDQFSAVSINWDPIRFPNTRLFHFEWPGNAKGQSSNHRYRVHTPTSRPPLTQSESSSLNEVWCLLTRHTRLESDDSEFIALHSFVSTGNETPNARLDVKDAYTDSAHCLVKLQDGTDLEEAVLVASRFASSDQECGYTLQIFSHKPVDLVDASQFLPHRREVLGSMTLANSGGHSMHPTFFLNPQYSLSVQPLPNSGSSSSFIRITLQGGKDAPLNVMVLWGGAKRITDVDQGDIVLDSGAYSYGIACASGPMKPGLYTLAVSAFTPRTTVDYSLVVEGSAPLEVASIPPEGSGRFSKLLKGSWEGNTSITYQITVLKPTTIQIRLQCIEAGPRAPISLSVTTAESTLIRGVEAATPILSVGWNDTISGILTDHTPLPAGSFLVKASTTQAGIGRRLVLTIYSSACAISGVTTN